jgi:hypothetical protein
MVQASVKIHQAGDYMDLTVSQYYDIWNRYMLQPNPKETWEFALSIRFEPEEMTRQAKLASILGISEDDEGKTKPLRFFSGAREAFP